MAKYKQKVRKAVKRARNWLAVHAHNRRGGTHTDRKKRANKKACRGKVTYE